MRPRPRVRLVSNLDGALYECRDCGSPNALSGLCRGCGVPAIVEDRPTRRPARPPTDWMLTLAHNLAIAGGMCRSFALGSECADERLAAMTSARDQACGMIQVLVNAQARYSPPQVSASSEFTAMKREINRRIAALKNVGAP